MCHNKQEWATFSLSLGSTQVCAGGPAASDTPNCPGNKDGDRGERERDLHKSGAVMAWVHERERQKSIAALSRRTQEFFEKKRDKELNNFPPVD